jgi:hypothetical protein
MAGFTIIDVSNPLVPIYVGHIEGAGAPYYLNGTWGVYLLSTPPPPSPPVIISKAYALSREEL